jgi:hypothetical protein
MHPFILDGFPMSKSRDARKRVFHTAIEQMAEQIERPLEDSFDLLWALDLVGHGLNKAIGREAGQPVLAIAAALSERLCVASEAWYRLSEPWKSKTDRK